MHGNFKRIFRLIILAINLYGLYITCLETLFIRVNSILSFSHSRKRVVVYIEKDLIALIIQFLINMLYTVFNQYVIYIYFDNLQSDKFDTNLQLFH